VEVAAPGVCGRLGKEGGQSRPNLVLVIGCYVVPVGCCSFNPVGYFTSAGSRQVVPRHARSPCGWPCAWFTRLPRAFSEKLASHEAAVLHALHFVRIHRTLLVTPAMVAGVTGRLLSIEDMAALLDWRLRRTQFRPVRHLGPDCVSDAFQIRADSLDLGSDC
jgi:hypothetical protein